GLLTVVTFGLGFPFLRRRLVQFAAESHSYGTTRFALPEGFKKPFIRPYFVFIGVSILLGVVLVAFFAAVGVIAGASATAGSDTPDCFAEAEPQLVSVAGDEVADFFDIDIAL